MYTGFYFSDNMGGFYYQSLIRQMKPEKFDSRYNTIEELYNFYKDDLNCELINGVIFVKG